MMSTYPTSWRGLLRRTVQVASLAALTALAACGGGGGNAGTPLLGGGGSTPTDPTLVEASDLSVVLSAATLPNNGQDRITATITAVDANRRALANIPVEVRVDAEALFTMSADKTNDQGVVVAQVGTGSDRSNRVVTITALSGSLTRTVTFQVVGAKITTRLTPAVLSAGASGRVEFILVDVNGNPMQDSAIDVQGIGGAAVSGRTGLSGQYVYAYVAPAAAGTYPVSATSGGATATAEVLVQSAEGGTVPNAVLTVQSASVSANPNAVATNSLNTENRAEVRALFMSTNNAPVQNVRVRFDLAGDQNSIGGTISSGTNYVYTNANGIAATSYSPGGRESPTNGVTVRACWDYRDFAVGTCPNAATTNLTVKNEPLSISIRTNNEIGSGTNSLTYEKDYLVQVNDATGVAKANVVITPTVDLIQYLRGYLIFAEEYFEGGVKKQMPLKWALPRTGIDMACDNEDINRNAVSESYASGAEDANGNGQLDPYKADVAVSFAGSNVTDAKGQVVVRITYAKSLAYWVTFKLRVTAGVLGTEGKAVYPMPPFAAVLPASVDDMTQPLREPSNAVSPFGVGSSPTITVTNTEGQTATLCTRAN